MQPKVSQCEEKCTLNLLCGNREKWLWKFKMGELSLCILITLNDHRDVSYPSVWYTENRN